MRGRAAAAGRGEPVAELHALERLDGDERPGEPGVELPVPLGEAAEARRQPVDDDLDDAAEGVAVPAGRVDLLDHPRAGPGVGAAHRVRVDPGQVGRRRRGRTRGHGDRAERHHVRDDLDAERLDEQLPGHLAERDPGGGLPRAGPLEDGPGVGVAELLHARQVGVAGPRPGQRGVARLPVEFLPGDRVGRHHRLPLGPLGVTDPDGDRPAQRDAVPHAAGELHLVLLELHPRAAPVARPPPRERRGHVLAGDAHPGGHAVTNRGQGFAVRLARRQPPKHAVHPTVSAAPGRREAAARRPAR